MWRPAAATPAFLVRALAALPLAEVRGRRAAGAVLAPATRRRLIRSRRFAMGAPAARVPSLAQTTSSATIV
jgi:hypothetical protein